MERDVTVTFKNGDLPNLSVSKNSKGEATIHLPYSGGSLTADQVGDFVRMLNAAADEASGMNAVANRPEPKEMPL